MLMIRAGRSSTGRGLAACCLSLALSSCGSLELGVERVHPAVATAGGGLPGPANRRGAENPWRDRARDLLLQSCGSCHRSSLPTARPRALAVFDLDELDWQRRLTDEQVHELRRRARATKEIDAWDQPTLDRFVACEIDGDCRPAAD